MRHVDDRSFQNFINKIIVRGIWGYLTILFSIGIHIKDKRASFDFIDNDEYPVPKNTSVPQYG